MRSIFINFKYFTLNVFLHLSYFESFYFQSLLHFDFSQVQIIVLRTLHFDFDSNMLFKGHDSHKYVPGYFRV